MTPAIINAAMYLAFCVFCVALPMAVGWYFLRRSDRREGSAQNVPGAAIIAASREWSTPARSRRYHQPVLGDGITSHLGPDCAPDALYRKSMPTVHWETDGTNTFEVRSTPRGETRRINLGIPIDQP